jgi:hypothetical protein
MRSSELSYNQHRQADRTFSPRLRQSHRERLCLPCGKPAKSMPITTNGLQRVAHPGIVLLSQGRHEFFICKLFVS